MLDLLTTGYKNNFHYVCQKKTKLFFKVRKVVKNIVKIMILSLIIVFSLLDLPKHSEKHSENRSENNGYGTKLMEQNCVLGESGNRGRGQRGF